MRALLFSMPDIYPQWTPMHIKGPNLALASIAGNCPNHKVYVGDLILKIDDVKGAIKEAMRRYKPDIIGLSAMTFQYPTLIKIARFINSFRPKIPIVIGGYHVTIMFKEIADSPESGLFDFMLRGESDRSFNELLDACEHKSGLEGIRGLSYNDGKEWHHNESRGLEDLNMIRLPKRDSRIWKGYHFLSDRYDTIESSRGCMSMCKFCSIRQMYGKSRREYPVERVIKDIKNAKKRGTKYLFFVDDNLTNGMKGMERFNQLLDAIIKNDLNDMRYATQASSIGMGSDERIIRKMRKAGFDFVFLGMENVSEKNLQYYNKGNIVNHTKRAVMYLRRNGIIVMGGLVQGMEDDKEEDFKLNFDFLIKSGVDNLMSQLLTPYPGTDFRDELMQKGLVTNKNRWSTYSGYFANVKTNHLSQKDLDYMQWKYSNQYYAWRAKNFWKLNVFKNHPYHCIKTSFQELVYGIPSAIRKIGKSKQECFRIDFERLLSLNRNLV